MLNTHTYAALVAMAGSDNTWPVAGTGEPDGTARKGYGVLLVEWQGGLCASCGDALDGAYEVAHVVGGTNVRRGWTGHNLIASHLGCNDFDQTLGTNVPLDSIVRPDLVMPHRPTRKELLAACERAGSVSDVQAARNARRAARMARPPAVRTSPGTATPWTSTGAARSFARRMAST